MKKIEINPHKLYQGCMLASISHAIAVGMYPDLDFEHSWDGMNYNINDGEGCQATITFHSQGIVAVFQNIEYISTREDIAYYFDGASDEIIQIATDEALQYRLDTINGKTEPVVTGAFWGNWNALFSNQSLKKVIETGGYILNNQLMNNTDALIEWGNYYELNDKQIALADKLCKMKLCSKTKAILLTKADTGCLYGNLEACKTSFYELNIYF